MKIAQIVCAYPPYAGGIGNSAHTIYNLLKDDYDIVNYTPDTLKPWLKRGHGALLPQLLWKLWKFDYIYLHYPFFGTAEIVWLFKILKPKAKLVIHYHMDVKNKSFINKILSTPSIIIRNNLLKKADVIVSASLDYIKNSQIKKFYHKYPEKFLEIPFALNSDIYCPKEIFRPSENKVIAKAKDLIKKINEVFIKKNRLDLIFIGGLDKAHYFKGIPILLQALSLLKFTNWTLAIVGDGDLKEIYQKQAEDLKLNNNIEFKGKLDDKELIRTLQNSDALVLPSTNQNEAFGIVLIEAMACGVPVIASDLPGVRSVFTNEREGLLIKPGDIEDLKDKIEFLARNDSKRLEMARYARRLVLNRYTISKMKETYENLFNK